MRVLLVLGSFLIGLTSIHASSRAHGGGGVVCSESSSHGESSVKVQLLDFWEGKKIRNLDIPTDKVGNINDFVEIAISKLFAFNPELHKHVKKVLPIVIEAYANKIVLENGIQIEAPNDAINQYTQSNCEVQGLALFSDVHNSITVNGNLINKLSLVDEAGLIIHEAVYKVMRDLYGVKDSVTARGITACIFSESGCPKLSTDFSIINELPELNHYYKCKLFGTQTINYKIIPLEGNIFRFEFLNLPSAHADLPVIPPTYMFVDIKLPEIVFARVFYDNSFLHMISKNYLEMTYDEIRIFLEFNPKIYAVSTMNSLKDFGFHIPLELKFLNDHAATYPIRGDRGLPILNISIENNSENGKPIKCEIVTI